MRAGTASRSVGVAWRTTLVTASSPARKRRVQNVGGEISRAKMSKIAQKGGTLAERRGRAERQTPNFKLQTPEKLQAPNFKNTPALRSASWFLAFLQELDARIHLWLRQKF